METADETEQRLRMAADAGGVDAMWELAVLLNQSDRYREALPYLLRASAAEHPMAMNAVAWEFLSQKRYDEAEPLLRKAVAAGEIRARRNLGRLLWETGRAAEAEPWLRSAAEKADIDAIMVLMRLPAGTGRQDEATRWGEWLVRNGYARPAGEG
ncbi:MAG TPA: tetratricopeptide repeat protein [Actinomadura sp.]|nr:tetratricopeptide repeat protein [Actinomadura sp.]